MIQKSSSYPLLLVLLSFLLNLTSLKAQETTSSQEAIPLKKAEEGKNFSISLNLPFPTGIRNFKGYDAANYQGPDNPGPLITSSAGLMAPGIGVEYKGWFVNVYYVWQYGPVDDRNDFIAPPGFNNRLSSTSTPDHPVFEDPFFITPQTGTFLANIGYQHTFDRGIASKGPDYLLGGGLSYTSLEVFTGLEFEHLRLILYTLFAVDEGFDGGSTVVFLHSTQLHGGLRLQFRMF